MSRGYFHLQDALWVASGRARAIASEEELDAINEVEGVIGQMADWQLAARGVEFCRSTVASADRVAAAPIAQDHRECRRRRRTPEKLVVTLRPPRPRACRPRYRCKRALRGSELLGDVLDKRCRSNFREVEVRNGRWNTLEVGVIESSGENVLLLLFFQSPREGAAPLVPRPRLSRIVLGDEHDAV